MSAGLTPITRWQILDNGVISPGAKLYTYASGTSTPLAVYNNADLAIGHAHTNPVVADAEGVLPVIFLLPQAYRFLVTDASGATIFPAQDDITSASLTLPNDSVTYAMLQNVSATARVLGRKTAGAGDVEELTLSEVLDLVGSAAQGDILYRDSATWAKLAAGTSGQFLKTQGTAANPVWATIEALDRDGSVNDVNTTTAETTVYTKSIDAGLLGTTRELHFTLVGDELNNTGGNVNLTVRITYGATTILTTGTIAIGTDSARRSVSLQGVLFATGATNAQGCYAWFRSPAGGAGGTMAAFSGSAVTLEGYGTAAEDSTAAKTFAITVQWGTSSASVSFRAHHITLVLR